MVFKKREKPPLDCAIDLVYKAVAIAYQYQHDKQYLPTPADLKRFENLLEALWQGHCTVDYIARCQRTKV